jgi:hypothetical protein
MDNRSRYRSLFWPIVLIGVGIIWLLANLGLLPGQNLAILARLWPLLLIAVGLDLLIGRRVPLIGALIGLGTVAVVIALLLVGPGLGLAPSTLVRTEQFSEPVGEATSASVRLDFWSDPATISTVQGSANLIEVDSTHTGRIDFRAEGSAAKTVSLANFSQDPTDWFTFGQPDQRTDVRLSPQVPLELSVDIGSGSVELNLHDLNLSRLEIDGGSGSAEITLPAGGDPFEGNLRTGSGSVDILLPAGGQGTLEIDTGSGSVQVDIPEQYAVRIEVRDSGSGSLSLPSGLEQVEQFGDEEGAWETAAYSGSDRRVLLIFEGVGSGSIRIH